MVRRRVLRSNRHRLRNGGHLMPTRTYNLVGRTELHTERRMVTVRWSARATSPAHALRRFWKDYAAVRFAIIGPFSDIDFRNRYFPMYAHVQVESVR